MDEEWMQVPLKWIKILAGSACLIGLIGLAMLMAQGFGYAFAADPVKGFDAGPRTFTQNPFAGAAPNKGGSFFEEEDEEDDFEFPDDDFPVRPSNPQGGAQAPAKAGAGDAAPAADGTTIGKADPKIGPKGISVGGTQPGGVIAHSKAPSSLHIDDETAEGSREIVTDFNFPDADIMDIAKALGKLTGKNFILDKDVKGRVTIISNAPITVGDAWKAFLTALDMNGFALIPSGKYIRIARQRDARDKQLKTYTGDFSPDTDALITRLFPLKYLSAEEVARNFRSFMPANSRIIPYEQTNTVIVTDTGSNIAKLQKLLEILDVEGYDAGIEVIPVKFASAVELSKLIDTLIPGTSGVGGGPGGPPRFGGAGKFNARRTKEGGIINTIIADERTNTLIVHANTKGADQVRELVTKLDQKLPATTGGGKVHVIYLQFAEAEAMSNTLNNLSQSPGSRPSGGPSGTGVNPVQSSLFEGNIKVSPDKATNSLVVTASPSDFVTIQRVVNKLDIQRDEVYVEAIIMEIALDRDFGFSANLALPASGIALTPSTDLLSFIANPLSQQGAVLGFKGGNTVTMKIDGKDTPVNSIMGLIKAIQSNSNANVLATPQILTLDNTEAVFESSEKIPVATTTTTQTGGTQSSYTKEPVSLTLTIKPQINKISNFVKMDVNAKMEDFSSKVPAKLQQEAFSTISRSAKTSVVVADGDTVVIGGLMRDSVSETISKIPLLGDIPLLGWLFRSTTSNTKKTNLMIFITPHIVRQYEKMRAILDKKLKQRDDFIESAAGGNDKMRHYRDEMIRSLPDMKDIMAAKNPNKVMSLNDDDPFLAAKPVEEAQPLPATPVAPLAAPPAAPPATVPAAPAAPAAPPPATTETLPPPPAMPGGE